MDHSSDEKSFEIIKFDLSKGGHQCGYCKNFRDSEDTSGIWAHSITPESYQLLLDRNWRRCGKYFYKPDNSRICCPMYTIRCDALNFKLRKSHKKIIKKFNNYIKYNSIPKYSKKNPNEISNDFSDVKILQNLESSQCSGEKFNVPSMKKIKLLNNSSHASNSKSASAEINISSEKTVEGDLIKNLNTNKRKFKRRQKLIQKIIKRENCSKEEAETILYKKSCQKQKAKTLEEFLTEIDDFPNAKHAFKIKFISIQSNALGFNQKDTGYEVFKKYQMAIHKEKEEDISFQSFKRFLIDTSFKFDLENLDVGRETELPSSYGTFHQQYFIDDRLVAVGVLDILPKCISSVYLFYDPEFSHLNLGVYSALREISLVRRYQKLLPDLKYYYLGFYVDQCPKMRYKGNFLPSDLLCSETFRWFSIQQCLGKLENSKYARFCDDHNVKDEDALNIVDSKILILTRNTIMSYSQYKARNKVDENEENKIYEYARLVGKKCANRLLYYL